MYLVFLIDSCYSINPLGTIVVLKPLPNCSISCPSIVEQTILALSMVDLTSVHLDEIGWLDRNTCQCALASYTQTLGMTYLKVWRKCPRRVFLPPCQAVTTGGFNRSMASSFSRPSVIPTNDLPYFPLVYLVWIIYWWHPRRWAEILVNKARIGFIMNDFRKHYLMSKLLHRVRLVDWYTPRAGS